VLRSDCVQAGVPAAVLEEQQQVLGMSMHMSMHMPATAAAVHSDYSQSYNGHMACIHM
jgi:hypothetical protein